MRMPDDLDFKNFATAFPLLDPRIYDKHKPITKRDTSFTDLKRQYFENIKRKLKR